MLVDEMDEGDEGDGEMLCFILLYHEVISRIFVMRGESAPSTFQERRGDEQQLDSRKIAQGTCFMTSYSHTLFITLFTVISRRVDASHLSIALTAMLTVTQTSSPSPYLTQAHRTTAMSLARQSTAYEASPETFFERERGRLVDEISSVRQIT
jgi:hypothetical protein